MNVLVEREGPFVWVWMNRPERRNALSLEHLAELRDAFAEIGESDARGVVLGGKGPVFSAGHDFADLAGADLDAARALLDTCTDLLDTMQAIPQPIVARVHGLATAAGCQLVAACDLAVAASTARFAVSGINVGLFCSSPSVALSRNLGRKAAFEMLVTGDFISAEDAKAKGLVNRVAAPEALDAEVESLVASIVAKPRVALAMGKHLFYRQLEVGVEAAYEDAGRTMACNMMDEAALEGVQAFIEKRKPSWAA